MDNSKAFSVSELTGKNGKYWRVDWFGYLKYDSSKGARRTEPLVEVFLSEFYRPPSDSGLLYMSATKYSFPRRVWVPIELLTAMRIGDVWRDGKLVKVPSYEELTLSFDSNDTSRIIAGAPRSGSGDFWICSRFHPYHMKATETYCEVVRVNENDVAIFPHYVITQAYFSKCSYTYRKIFQHGLTRGDLYNYDNSKVSDGLGKLILKKRVRDVAAEEVARIAWDNRGTRAALMISELLAVQGQNKRNQRAVTQFPFTGSTTIKAKGKWYPINDNERAFIVFDILSCSAPFPFEQLIHFRDNPGDKKPESEWTDNDYTSSQPPTTRPSAPDLPDILIDEEPSNDSDSMELPSRSNTDYVDLRGKVVSKKRMEDHKFDGMRGGGTIDVDGSELALGDGDQSGTRAGAVFSSGDEERSPNVYLFDHRVCRLELFDKFCRYYKSKADLQDCQYIPINTSSSDEVTGKYSNYPKAYTDSMREMKWHYINYIKGYGFMGEDKFRLRRCLIFKYTIAGKYNYLIEPERRIVQVEGGWREYDSTAILRISTYKELTMDHLCEVLESCSSNRGVWKPEPIGGCSFDTIRHPDNEAIIDMSYVEKIIKSLGC